MYKNYDFRIYCSQETHLEKVVVERSHIIKDEFYSSGCEVRNTSRFICLIEIFCSESLKLSEVELKK